jgi:hypothetical protein
MGNYRDTQYNHFQNCKRRIHDLISKTVIYGFTHEKLLEEREKDLFQFNSWKKLSGYYKEYIRGYFEASIDHLYRFDLIWLHYCDKNGKREFYETWNMIPNNTNFFSGRFWVKSRKPFSLNPESNFKGER